MKCQRSPKGAVIKPNSTAMGVIRPSGPQKRVSKPCWELKYCPYGSLVEFFPLLSRGDETVKSWWPDNEVMKWVHPGHVDLLKACDPFEISCNVFGHVCPVFAMAEGMTETKEERYSALKPGEPIVPESLIWTGRTSPKHIFRSLNLICYRLK
jgi:hypothetical protein